MRRKRHPLSGTLYEEIGEGLVRVTRNNASGVFRCDGRWLEGDVTQADLHMLVWVGAPNISGDRGPGSRREPEAVRD